MLYFWRVPKHTQTHNDNRWKSFQLITGNIQNKTFIYLFVRKCIYGFDYCMENKDLKRVSPIFSPSSKILIPNVSSPFKHSSLKPFITHFINKSFHFLTRGILNLKSFPRGMVWKRIVTQTLVWGEINCIPHHQSSASNL